MTKAQYFTDTVRTSVHRISDSTPSALSGVKRPPSDCTTVCSVYSGLVPRSPNTIPSAASLATPGVVAAAWAAGAGGLPAMPLPR